MTKDQIDRIQHIAFALADGAAIVFPVAGPFVKLAEQAIVAAEAAGIAPVEISPEQATAIAAGMAAARASAVTSFKSRGKR